MIRGPALPSGAPTTLAGALRRHAEARPQAPAFRFLDRHGRATTELTWRDLTDEAGRIAAQLQARDLTGRRVAIICPNPADFVLALSACLLAGVVAVPVPAVATRRSADRIRSIVASAEPAAILATGKTLAEAWIADLLADPRIVGADLDALSAVPPRALDEVTPDEGEAALIQFTSGSTQTPRGIVLTHRNIVANCRAIADAYGLDAQSRGLSWLPLHHDMGLVGHVLTPMWVGGISAIMNPLHFLQSPLRWLERVGEQRATITSAPNFAFDLCTTALGQEKDPTLDLSSLQSAICGGEPVWPTTVERFITAFAPYGFNPAAFAPSYGLAEATLLVASGKRADGPRIYSGMVLDVAEADPQGLEMRLTSMGKPVAGMAIRIVGDDGRECAEGTIGEVEISGDSVGAIVGETAPASRTGDLGFLKEGELYVAGRRKELIILRGQNVYPSDIEAAALSADPAVRPGGVAAIGVEVEGTEALVVIIEVDSKRLSGADIVALCRRVNDAVAAASGFTPKRTIAVAPGALPRTTSGKIQRGIAADMVMRNAFHPLDRSDLETVGLAEASVHD
jgi:nonribosomal peptide synthetase protein BlmVI